ncbi:MAG: MFS transporter [Acidimicrobiales bacterium]
MTAPTAETPSPTAGRHLGLALVVISAAQLMVVLDATIINVALPSIFHALHFSISNLVWVTTAYSLTFGGLLLFGGRTGDLYGRRRMFMVGIGIFTVASLLGGFATTDTWLILTRAMQGIGGAIASPTALALIATNFPEGSSRNKAMGVYAAMSGAGAAIGLIMGGILVDVASWRWVLFVNVPIGLVVLALTPFALHESETGTGRLDVPGAVSVTAGMTLLVYGLTHAASHPWASTGTVVPLAVAAALLAAVVVIELRSPHALLPLRIFANRNRSAAYAIMLTLGAAMFSMFYFLTLFLQNILGYSPLKTGFGFLPTALTIGITAQITARLVGRFGVRIPLLIGPLSATAAFAWFSRITPSSSYLDIIGPLLLLAIGMGTSFVPLTLTAVAGVSRRDSGLASALLNTGQQVGGALGLAVLSTVAVTATKNRIHHLVAQHVPASQIGRAATTHGYAEGFFFASLIALLAFVISAVAVRVKAEDLPVAPPEPATALG